MTRVSGMHPLRDRIICERLPMKDKTFLWTPKEMSLQNTIVPLLVVHTGADAKTVTKGMTVGIASRRLIDFCKSYKEGEKIFHIVHEIDIDGVFEDEAAAVPCE